MKEKTILLMAVDLGTSFIKTGIYNTEGECIALEQEAVKAEKPASGIFIQRAEQLFIAVQRCMARAAASAKGTDAVGAIAFTGQMAGFIGVDSQWNDVTTWSCSLDTRYLPYANQQVTALGGELLKTAGTKAPVMSPKIEWFRTEFPQKSTEIVKYMMISSYIIGKLSGCDVEESVIDCSCITWTGLADVHRKQWSDSLCNHIGITKELLPKIVDSDSICGSLSGEMAKIIGLKAGIPLVAGAGDKVAGCVGAGMTQTGDMIFEAGSYGGFSCLVDEYHPDAIHNYYDVVLSADAGKYLAHKYIPGSGITLNWFMENFAAMSAGNTRQAFEEMDNQAAMISPGCDGLMAIGLLGGSAMPFDANLKGAFMGYSWSHRKEHFYKALLESFAYEVALTMDSVEENYRRCPGSVIKIIGGGAKSGTWTQILADVTGKRFHRLDREDIALWGAAIIAGKAIGIFPDMDAGAARIGVRRIYEPDVKSQKDYLVLKQRYESCRGEMSKWSMNW